MAMSAFGILSAQDGKMNAFALVPLMWSVALGAGLFHCVTELGVAKKLGSKMLVVLSRAAHIAQWRIDAPAEAASSGAAA